MKSRAQKAPSSSNSSTQPSSHTNYTYLSNDELKQQLSKVHEAKRSMERTLEGWGINCRGRGSRTSWRRCWRHKWADWGGGQGCCQFAKGTLPKDILGTAERLQFLEEQEVHGVKMKGKSGLAGPYTGLSKGGFRFFNFGHTSLIVASYTVNSL